MQSYATDTEKRPLVTRLLDFYAENGLTVLRTWAFSDGSRPDALQTAPGLATTQLGTRSVVCLSLGVLNEWAAASLDFVIHEAAVRGIKLLLVLTNYWSDYGGMQQYVRQCHFPTPYTFHRTVFRWAKGDAEADVKSEDFYRDPKCFDAFVAYISTLLNRRNTISGVLYKDDPAIFAWSVANEPRCMSDTTGNPLNVPPRPFDTN